MSEVSKRIPEIDMLRGIAATLMILGHSFIVYPVDISNVPWCSAIGHFIYTFHMELFFVLAGVVYHCREYGSYIKKKIQRILIPYLFFGIISMLLHAFGGGLVNGNESIGNGIAKMIFQGGSYWFLYVLFIIFAIFPWIERGVKDKRGWLFLTIALLLLSSVVDLPNIFSLQAVVRYLPYFILGHCFREIVRGGYHNKRSRTIQAFVSFLLYLILNMMEKSGVIEFGVILSYIRAISIIIFLYIVTLELRPYWDKNRFMAVLCGFLNDCSKFSLQLYLFNGYLLAAIRIVMCRVLHITSPIWLVLTIWIGNLAITIISCKWIIPRIPIIRNMCGIGK